MNFYEKLKYFGNRTVAIDDTGEVISYSELEEFAKDIAAIIKNRNLVFISCKNQIGSLCSYISCLYTLNVALLLNQNINTEHNKALVKKYKPNYIFLPLEELDEIQGYYPIYEKYGYVLLKLEEQERVAIHKDLALLMTTSGSTGNQKLVRLRYKNLNANTKSIVEYLELDKDEMAITTLPMSYAYGLSVINSHLQVGAIVCMTKKVFYKRSFGSFSRIIKLLHYHEFHTLMRC